MAMEWKKVKPFLQTETALDPYIDWALRTEFRYLFAVGVEKKWIPVLLGLAGTTARDFANKWCPPDEPDAWKDWLRIPTTYARPAAGLNRTRFCTASVTKTFFKQLEEDQSLSGAIAQVGLGLPVNTHKEVKAAKPKPTPEGKAKPKMVVIGIIDDGLAIAHERFLGNDGETRIEYVWCQDGPPNTVPGQIYGQHLQKRGPGGINALMTQCKHGGLAVDEDELYRLTGQADFGRTGHKSAAWRASHGTHVMDVACGADRGKAPENRPIVCVQLPMATTAEPGGGTLGPHVADGIRYILDRADDIAGQAKCGPLPVVINLSYGLMAGPHDGSYDLETDIDDMVRSRMAARGVPLVVVLPSGNSRQLRCHARFRLDNKCKTKTLKWRVPPDDRTQSFLEIWLPRAGSSGAVPKVEVLITAPGGVATPFVIVEGDVCVLDSGPDILGEAIYKSAAETGTRAMIKILLKPTWKLDTNRDVAPSGTWAIEVTNAGPDVDIEAWIERDEAPYGYPRRGRQSRFEDPGYEYRNDAGRLVDVDNAGSYIQRDGAHSGIATGGEAVVIGGYRRSDQKPALYSAGGLVTRPPGGGVLVATVGPDATAVSEDSVTCDGVLAAGARSGSCVAMYGTSVAAPQVTCLIADLMAWNLQCDRNAIAAKAVPWPAPSPPVTRVGAGRIEIRPVAPAPPIPRFEE